MLDTSQAQWAEEEDATTGRATEALKRVALCTNADNNNQTKKLRPLHPFPESLDNRRTSTLPIATASSESLPSSTSGQEYYAPYGSKRVQPRPGHRLPARPVLSSSDPLLSSTSSTNRSSDDGFGDAVCLKPSELPTPSNNGSTPLTFMPQSDATSTPLESQDPLLPSPCIMSDTQPRLGEQDEFLQAAAAAAAANGGYVEDSSSLPTPPRPPRAPSSSSASARRTLYTAVISPKEMAMHEASNFKSVKGVYKNCRGIWAAQWTDERGQRHTKYFNPKYYASEAEARHEAFRFKVHIAREIELRGGVQRKRSTLTPSAIARCSLDGLTNGDDPTKAAAAAAAALSGLETSPYVRNRVALQRRAAAVQARQQRFGFNNGNMFPSQTYSHLDRFYPLVPGSYHHFETEMQRPPVLNCYDPTPVNVAAATAAAALTTATLDQMYGSYVYHVFDNRKSDEIHPYLQRVNSLQPLINQAAPTQLPTQGKDDNNENNGGQAHGNSGSAPCPDPPSLQGDETKADNEQSLVQPEGGEPNNKYEKSFAEPGFLPFGYPQGGFQNFDTPSFYDERQQNDSFLSIEESKNNINENLIGAPPDPQQNFSNTPFQCFPPYFGDQLMAPPKQQSVVGAAAVVQLVPNVEEKKEAKDGDDIKVKPEDEQKTSSAEESSFFATALIAAPVGSSFCKCGCGSVALSPAEFAAHHRSKRAPSKGMADLVEKKVINQKLRFGEILKSKFYSKLPSPFDFDDQEKKSGVKLFHKKRHHHRHRQRLDFPSSHQKFLHTSRLRKKSCSSAGREAMATMFKGMSSVALSLLLVNSESSDFPRKSVGFSSPNKKRTFRLLTQQLNPLPPQVKSAQPKASLINLEKETSDVIVPLVIRGGQQSLTTSSSSSTSDGLEFATEMKLRPPIALSHYLQDWPLDQTIAPTS